MLPCPGPLLVSTFLYLSAASSDITSVYLSVSSCFRFSSELMTHPKKLSESQTPLQLIMCLSSVIDFTFVSH